MSNQIANHYETLQLNPNATQETVEKMFRFLASQFHPDVGGDKDKFNAIVAAFEVLRDPQSRATYDIQLKHETGENERLVEHSKQAGPDAAIRHELLCLFYARRRQSGTTPALGSVSIEKTLKIPQEVLDFHLWYFREKGWVKREENGGFAITAAGVDRIEESEFQLTSNLRIESTFAGPAATQNAMTTAVA